MKKENTIESKENARNSKEETHHHKKRKPHKKIVPFVKKYKLDIISLIVLILFFVFTNIGTISGLNQLPSPIYGGDYYYQMGCVNHIKYGGNAFDNCNLISENPGYFPFYGILVAGFANLFNLDTIDAMLYSSPIIYALAVIVAYLTFRIIFKKFYFGIIGVFLAVTITSPILKYTPFARWVIVPLFVLFLYLFFKKQTYLRAALLGLIVGIATITHSTLFPISYAILGVFVLLILFNINSDNFNIKKISIKKTYKRLLKLFPILFVLGIISVSISMLYWFSPLIISHAKTSPHYLEWNGPGDMSNLDLQLDVSKKIIKNTMFRFDSFTRGVKSILFLMSLASLFFIRTKSKDIKFVWILTATAVLINFSHFITMPLLGMHFVPDYIYSVFTSFVVVLFAVGFLYILRRAFKNKVKNINTIFIIGILLLTFVMMGSYNSGVKDFKETQWYKVGFNEIEPAKKDLEKYLLENTEVNDVILTTKEIGFFVNALSGRKLVVARRAQNDAFEDMDIREMEAGIILYGNSPEKTKELLKKYNVKYLYWDQYWFQSEYYFDNQGKITGWFDPLIGFNENPENAVLLDKYNVSYAVQKSFVDPSLRTEFHPQFDLVFVSPLNYRNFTNPWRETLDPFLEEVWSHEQNNQKTAVLYRVEY